MVAKEIVVCIIIIIGALQALEDEYYCKNEEGRYKICRRCNDVSGSCDVDYDNEDCRCDNIQLYSPLTEGLKGGSKCLDGYCYVGGETSACKDLQDDDNIDNWALNVKGVEWHHEKGDFYRSKEACNGNNKVESNTGNEDFIMGVKILKDKLLTPGEKRNGSNLIIGGATHYSDYAEDHKDCQQQCIERCDVCGSWSYDTIEEECYLFTMDGCCGQNDKREDNKDYISGYVCKKCWSTRNECPSVGCSLKERQTVSGCKTSQSAGDGAGPSDFNSASGLLRVDKIHVNEDPCACIPTVTRRGKNRCRRQKCVDVPGCKDLRRCRPGRKRNT